MAVWIVATMVVTIVIFIVLYPALFIIRDRGKRIDTEARALQVALSQYKEQFGQFPSGDTRAVCRSLSGDNPKGIRFIEWRRQSTTPEGDFLDPWGTPYMIYFSGDMPLIRSAGKNKLFDSSEQKGADDCFSS